MVISMCAICEIIAAMLAVIGIWSLFGMLREHLLYPKRVRKRLLPAVIRKDRDEDLTELEAYARYLCRNGKISSKRLIILEKCDIINENHPQDGESQNDVGETVDDKQR